MSDGISIVINRNNRLFDPAVTDELNSAFYKINKKIENYKTEDLDYKEKIQYIKNSNSFITDSVLHIRETFKIDETDLGKIFLGFYKIKELPYNVNFDVWGSAISKDCKSVLTYHIIGKNIFVTGNTFLNQEFVIVEDIII